MRGVEGKATIMDVARLAEVSIKTVSRVINNEPNVRDEMRERVTRAAEMLNYRPNLSARSLAGVRSFLIGYLFGDPGGDYTHRIEVGLLDRCRQAGYHLLVEQIDAEAADVAERAAAIVARLSLDGVILTAPITDHPDVLRVLRDAKVPFVRIAPDRESSGSPQVRMDDARAACELTEHLIALGHRRIGFIRGDARHAAARLRYDGFRRAIAAHNIRIPDALVEEGSFSYESGLACARRLLERSAPPTAIVASNDDMAAAAIAVAHDMRIKVPAQLSVVGFDDAPIAEIVWPALTTVRQPIRQMAESAANLLIAQAANKNGAIWPDPMPHCELPYEIVLRQSTAPVGDRAKAKAARK